MVAGTVAEVIVVLSIAIGIGTGRDTTKHNRNRGTIQKEVVASVLLPVPERVLAVQAKGAAHDANAGRVTESTDRAAQLITTNGDPERPESSRRPNKRRPKQPTSRGQCFYVAIAQFVVPCLPMPLPATPASPPRHAVRQTVIASV